MARFIVTQINETQRDVELSGVAS